MQTLSILAFVASAIAAALPDASLEERQASCTVARPGTLAAAKAAFTQAELVPDLVPRFDPKVAVMANWNGKEVQLGNEFNSLGTHGWRNPTHNSTS